MIARPRLASTPAEIEAALLDLKDLRLAQERSADALESILALLRGQLRPDTGTATFGDTQLDRAQRRLLDAILPVLAAQFAERAVLVSDIADCMEVGDAAAADLSAVIWELKTPEAKIRLGNLLGCAADETAVAGCVGAYRVTRGKLRGKSQTWCIDPA